LIGAELETGCAVCPGWTDSASKDKIESWEAKAKELEDIVDDVVQNNCITEYLNLLRKVRDIFSVFYTCFIIFLQRLGLLTSEDIDETDIINDLLNRMQNQSLDFHITFRTLCSFSPGAFLEEFKRGDKTYCKKFIEKLVPAPTASSSKIPLQDSEALLETGRKELETWLEKYAQRVMGEREAWMERVTDNSDDMNTDVWEREREAYMRSYNPRFVLRQWVLEEVIKKCTKDPNVGKRILTKVMEVCTGVGLSGLIS
jgi:serine/tyrosine/threonine adenylyltransferase